MVITVNNIRVSYHGGHSAEFCDHAVPGSTTAALVESYYEKGFRHVAITEHRPPFDDAYVYPDEKDLEHDAAFLQERFQRYFTSVREDLLRQWEGKLHLLFGFETEYYGEDPLVETLKLINQYRPDMVVASVHHVENIPIDFSEDEYRRATSTVGGLDELYTRYFDHQFDLICGLLDLLEGRPIIIGHFDLVKIFSPDHSPSDVVLQRMKRNIEAAVEAECVFEVNARAFKKGLPEPYPGAAVLELIAELGGEVTLGDDAHGPDEVGLFYEKSLPFVERYFDHVVAFERQGEHIQRVSIPLK